VKSLLYSLSQHLIDTKLIFKPIRTLWISDKPALINFTKVISKHKGGSHGFHTKAFALSEGWDIATNGLTSDDLNTFFLKQNELGSKENVEN